MKQNPKGENLRVELKRITADAEELIEEMAKESTGAGLAKTPEARRRFIRKRLMEAEPVPHEGPIEFPTAIVRVTGISLVSTHQLVRTRIATYMQRSMRRVLLSDAVEYTVPGSVIEKDGCDIFNRAWHEAFEAYEDLVDLGVPKEDARYILPVAVNTAINVKMDFAGWLRFFTRRDDKHAQWEIRLLAKKVRELLAVECPGVFG